MIPLVAIAGITAFAVLDLRRQLRDHDVNRGLCKHCGYDLRASPDGRCPECGITTIRI
jgi:rubrerythrin